jgi:hypothetical protein
MPDSVFARGSHEEWELVARDRSISVPGLRA